MPLGSQQGCYKAGKTTPLERHRNRSCLLLSQCVLAWCHAQNLGYIWTEESQKNLERKLSAVEVASAFIDEDPTALTAIAEALSHCGDWQRASGYFERALALDPNNAWAWARYGWVAGYSGKADRARAWFKRAMTLSPADPLAFNVRMGLALSLALAGELSEAVSIAREVVNQHPDATWPHQLMTAWSAMSGDEDTARWASKELLAAEPGFTIELCLTRTVFRVAPHWTDQMAEGLRQAEFPER